MGSRSVLLIVTFLLVSTVLFAQKENWYYGRIVDESGDPVPYCNVLIVGKAVGTSADQDGLFRMIIGTSYQGEVIAISSVGYLTFRIPVSELNPGEENVFTLKRQTTMLEEIVIEADETAESLMKKVVKRLRLNLARDPFITYSFYNEHLLQNGEHKGFTEGWGLYYDEGYQPSHKMRSSKLTYDLVQWKELHRSHYPTDNNNNERLIGVYKLLTAKNQYLYSGPLTRSGIRKYTYKIDSLMTYEERTVYVVRFNSDEVTGTMLVDFDTKALTRLEVEHEGDGKMSKFKVGFIEINGRYYTNYLSLVENSGDEVQTFELATGEYRMNSIPWLSYEQRWVLFNEMINPVISYTDEFWSVYTRIDKPEFASAKTDLEKERKLEEQFGSFFGRRIRQLPEGFTSYEEIVNNRAFIRLYFELGL